MTRPPSLSFTATGESRDTEVERYYYFMQNVSIKAGFRDLT
jgi:hypothetical protein